MHRTGERPAGGVPLQQVADKTSQRYEARAAGRIIRIADSVIPAFQERTPKPRFRQAIVELPRAEVISPAAVDEVEARRSAPIAGKG